MEDTLSRLQSVVDALGVGHLTLDNSYPGLEVVMQPMIQRLELACREFAGLLADGSSDKGRNAALIKSVSKCLPNRHLAGIVVDYVMRFRRKRAEIITVSATASEHVEWIRNGGHCSNEKQRSKMALCAHGDIVCFKVRSERTGKGDQKKSLVTSKTKGRRLIIKRLKVKDRTQRFERHWYLALQKNGQLTTLPLFRGDPLPFVILQQMAHCSTLLSYHSRVWRAGYRMDSQPMPTLFAAIRDLQKNKVESAGSMLVRSWVGLSDAIVLERKAAAGPRTHGQEDEDSAAVSDHEGVLEESKVAIRRQLSRTRTRSRSSSPNRPGLNLSRFSFGDGESASLCNYDPQETSASIWIEWKSSEVDVGTEAAEEGKNKDSKKKKSSWAADRDEKIKRSKDDDAVCETWSPLYLPPHHPISWLLSSLMWSSPSPPQGIVAREFWCSERDVRIMLVAWIAAGNYGPEWADQQARVSMKGSLVSRIQRDAGDSTESDDGSDG